MNKFFGDFKSFISKGNVIDLAVAVVIGAAFKPVISALVDNIIMPPIGLALGGVDFSDLKFVIQQATLSGTAEVAIGYGVFVQSVIDFVIIGFCVFLVVQAYNKLQEATAKKEAIVEEITSEPEASTEEKLLSEIRDILKESSTANRPTATAKN
ncbi:MAG: large-conductance mechanosensitive channel protein MscL [Cyanobacteria bacterium]|nr:large-conductance mechanosensitive channel protein MscL [Cyanobacteriota bacterium]MDA1021633.1 large-conductance mechanosensitive channel protein MscL [Cyanobacteriota bacterium]